ncbi:MAG TPA: hypothetical protein ENK98_07165 [Epsilonproteobacteria bacterium]|nr:hypothetical protein [Campylobacterota bacterium]
MHSDKSSKVREVFKKIDMKDVKILCKYPLPKGVKLKDFIIAEKEENKKECIIGLGDCGIDIVENIIKDNSDYFSLMADISHRNLNKLDAEYKLYLMGDVKDKEMLTLENRRTLSEFVRAHKKVYIVTRLDNDLNQSHVVDKIVQHLNRIKRDVVLIVIKPFLFELPPYRVELIEQILQNNKSYVNRLIVFDSQELLALKEVRNLSMKESFRYFDKIIKDVIENNDRFNHEKVVNINLIEVFNERE